MAVDTAPLLRKVAELADDLERNYGSDVELVDGVILVELRGTDSDGDPISTVEARIVSNRNTVGIGITTRGLVAMSIPDDISS